MRVRREVLMFTCDGCGAEASPKDARAQGWTKTGLYYPRMRPDEPGQHEEWHWCPQCPDNADQLRQRERDSFEAQYGKGSWARHGRQHGV